MTIIETADPGGAFATDTHRRVMANVPNPDDDPLSVDELLAERVAKDDYLDVDADELAETLADLEADGHAKKTKAGWKNTPAGFKALTGPPEEES
jgi:hypothetical protein